MQVKASHEPILTRPTATVSPWMGEGLGVKAFFPLEVHDPSARAGSEGPTGGPPAPAEARTVRSACVGRLFQFMIGGSDASLETVKAVHGRFKLPDISHIRFLGDLAFHSYCPIGGVDQQSTQSFVLQIRG